MSDQSSFWSNISTYCTELAAVAGPLLGAIGETAGALERAERHTRPRLNLSAQDARLLRAEYPPEDEG